MKRANNNSMQRFCSRFLAYTAVRPHSHKLYLWNTLLSLASLYSVVATPLLIVFPSARYAGHATVEALLDITFLFGVFIKLRTTHISRDGDAHSASYSARVYMRSSDFTVDLIAALPLEQLASAIGRAANADAPTLDALRWLQLLRALRGLYVIRRMRELRGANVVRVVQMLAGFLVFAHYLGLFWYALAVWPLQASPAAQPLHPWLWQNETLYDSATLYVCSLYWALAVMTNLKGNSAHESRQCLYESDVVVAPLRERIFTIFVFVIGATFYSVIYGNIGQFVSNLYQAGQRYKRRVAEIEEFIRFHGLSSELGSKIHKYVDYAFSVTRGINVEGIASQLPPHLQLEVYLQLNRQMVMQVSIFQNASDDFYRALVMKLSPLICIAGDYVFYKGEHGSRMCGTMLT